jgi:hypothetical protein
LEHQQTPLASQQSILTAEHLLLNLSREERGQRYSQLRHFVQWLLEKRQDGRKLKELDEKWKSFDASLEEEVRAGKLSSGQALVKKGDATWWRAMEEIRGASLYMALSKITKRELVAAFTEQPAKTNETLDELQIEIEIELTAKLRDCLSDETLMNGEPSEDARARKLEAMSESLLERRKRVYEELAKGAE